MKFKLLLQVSIAPAILIGCHSSPCADVLIKKDTTVKSERENTLFVFVGEKIDVREMPYTEGSMDGEFFARYKVIQKVYGCYDKDTIEFTAFDHYGWPDFSHFKNVLLYVSEHKGKYYHEKYQYDVVGMTQSGRWAGPYNPNNTYDYTNLSVIFKRVDFTDSLTFPLKTVFEDGEVIDHHYPHPFYWTVGDKAIADYGIYIEDLFRVKKEGVLTARGLFGIEETEPRRLIPQDVELEEVAPDHDDGTLSKRELERLHVTQFWEKFRGWIVEKNNKAIQRTLLDSLWVCGSLFTKQKLMAGCYNEIFDSTVVAELKRRKRASYNYSEIELKDLLPCARNRIVEDYDGYAIKKLTLFEHTYPENVPNLELSFIKTRNGYRLYDIRYPRNRSCCF